ncbi:MAG: matrilysin family metalloendoprotease [Nitrosospira sp.]|nr:matrilysin family metalloendoprotease [Nitrosospira sp.]MDN5882915.1 matrilysin family metalloendoprotease [Nitrosospira sp.]
MAIKQCVPPFAAIAKAEPAIKGARNPDLTAVQDFLIRFGYLEEGKCQAAELDSPTSEALIKYQEYYNLSPTGDFTQATRDQMTKGRCGMPDMIRGIEFTAECAWERFRLTFAFDSETGDIRGSAELQAVRNAFRTWAVASPLVFSEITPDENPDILIGWRPARDFDHNMGGGVLAHADFPPGCSIIASRLPLPLHFDDSEHVWTIGAAANAFDVETVALHEIGHLLGLGHSRVAGSVMFPSVNDNFIMRTLTADDIFGIRTLYPFT